MEKTTLKRIAGPINAPEMIEGSDGPIIFPFAKIDDEFRRVRRSQLVHHNSEIAILVAHKSNFNVSIKPRASAVLPEGSKTSGDTSAAAKKSAAASEKSTTAGTGASYPVLLMPTPGLEYHPEVESTVKEDDAVSKPAEVVVVQQKEVGKAAEEEPEKEESITMPVKSRPVRLKKSGRQKKKPLEKISESTYEDEGLDTVFEDSTESSQDSNFYASSTSDETIIPSGPRRPGGDPSVSDEDTSGIHIPKANVKHYFQWQFEKLSQQLEEEERCTQSDISVCNTHSMIEPDSLSVGDEALKFYKMADKLGEQEYANRFLLLMGHCILSLMKKPEFLDLKLGAVYKILSSDYLGVARERNVLRAAYAWLQHRPATRKRHTSNLMGAVRFGLLTKKDQIKCLAHNKELLAVLLNVPPFQRAFLKSCLWNYAQDAGLHSLFKEYEAQPRISYIQFFNAIKRSGKASYASGMPPYFSSALLPSCCHTPMAGFNVAAAPVENKGAKDGKNSMSGILAHVSASTAVVIETNA